MKITSSYAVKLMVSRSLLDPTIQIYRNVVAFLIDVANQEWDMLGPVFKKSKLLGQQSLEHLIHSTKSNPIPKYDFDSRFYKFPGYLRRAAMSAALGAVSSYHSNLKNWENSGMEGKPPKLSYERNAMPTFFRDNMSDSEAMLAGKSDTVYLKLYLNHDWVYHPVPCRHQDVKYLAKWWSHVHASAPTLEIQHRKGGKSIYQLRYAFEEYRELSLRDEPLSNRTILAVDLGINNDAVCSVMCANGTVMARKFINFPREKDHLQHLLNRVKRLQREHGRTGGKHEWAKVNRINDQLSRSIAHAIADFAAEYAVNVIVFEHLNMQGKIKGSKRQRLHLWRKQAIQKMVEHRAHRNLMRVSTICAWNTSKLAFDGSGEIFRGYSHLTASELDELIQLRSEKKLLPKTNHGQELCTFTNGKEYNCDLSASYNIGARYFLRELCKEVPGLVDKLPKATMRTYADLRALAVS